MKNFIKYFLVLLCIAGIAVNSEASSKKGKEKIPTKETNKNHSPSGSVNLDDLYVEDKLGFIPPYVPVLNPPLVKKVWIPPHISELDPDVMVGGHWVFIKITEDRWFIENEDPKSMNFPVVIPTAQENK